MKILKLLPLILLIISLNSYPLEIHPFTTQGKQVDDYNTTITPEKINPGDIIIIDSTKDRFLVKGYLNSGNRTYMYKVVDLAGPNKKERALRIPKFKKDLNLLYTYGQYLTTYITGADKLKKLSTRVPNIHKAEKDQFILVDLIGEHFSLTEFLRGDSPEVENQSYHTIMREFRNFIKDTMAIAHIGDMHLGQIVYDIDNSRWIFLDWSSTVMKRLSFKADSHFLTPALSRQISLKDQSKEMIKGIEISRTIIREETALAVDIEKQLLLSLSNDLDKIENLESLIPFIKTLPSNLTEETHLLAEKEIMTFLEKRGYEFLNENISSRKIMNIFIQESLARFPKLKAYMHKKLTPSLSCKEIISFIF